MAELTETNRLASERKFVVTLAVVATFVAILPALFGWISSSSAARYVGYQFNTDDHMVYAAWMRQAVDGRFFFDNRFTTDPQPGLTVHLYFWVLGLIAKITGIAVASTLGRVVFSLLFIWQVYRLVQRLGWEIYATKLAVALTVVGGGLGFLVWHNFGQGIVRPSPLSGLMLGKLPTDVWQPEGFVLPSMLTNGLFMVSLCLILVIFRCFLEARESSRAVWVGAVSMALLMNIHSYDVLLIALSMVGFLAATLVQRQATGAWIGRAALIAVGAVPSALWFVHVLRNDPVFQSRAATETYSPNFRQVLFGYLLLIGLALAGAMHRASDPATRGRRRAGIGLIGGLYLVLFFVASGHDGGYFLGAPGFALVFLVAVAGTALASDENPTWNLLFSWAAIGTIAIYFPGLFQRKLAMGLSVPWAILAAYGLHAMLRTQERSSRNLVLTLSIVLLGASGFRWIAREFGFIRTNVASTGRHPVFLNVDEQKILDALNAEKDRRVVLALPGAASPLYEEGSTQPTPDTLASPSMPDLAPFATGLTGAYTYAGHWSETPHYDQKVGEMYRFFLRTPFESIRRVMSPEERLAFIRSTGATHAILPVAESYPNLPLVTAEELGDVVVSGPQFRLIRLRR